MSFPLTIPVSMPTHHYAYRQHPYFHQNSLSNSEHYFGHLSSSVILNSISGTHHTQPGQPPPPPPPPNPLLPASSISDSNHTMVLVTSSANSSPPLAVVSGVNMMDNTNSHAVGRSSSSSSTTSSAAEQPQSSSVQATVAQRTPIRKQSVFVAPTGISALRAAAAAVTSHSSNSGVIVSSDHQTYVNTSPSPPFVYQQQQQSHQRNSTNSSRPEWFYSSTSHPLDLSEGTHQPSSVHLSVIQSSSGLTPSSSSLSNVSSLNSFGGNRLDKLPTKEDVSQHIQQLIMKNKALIDSFEPFLSHSRHHHQHIPSSGSSLNTKRSLSTTQLLSQKSSSSLGISSSSSLAFSPTFTSQASHYPYGTYQPQSEHNAKTSTLTNLTDNFDRSSSDTMNQQVHNHQLSSSYSKLQSALLGEAMSRTSEELTASGTSTKVHPGRKYSEIPYRMHQQQQPGPTFAIGHHSHHAPHHHPYQVPYGGHFYHSKTTRDGRPVVIVNEFGANETVSMALPSASFLSPLNESSRSSSEPSLVRNLLTSKTSSFAHLGVAGDNNSLQHSHSSTSTQFKHNSGSGTGDSSIIKDLLLKSRHSSVITTSLTDSHSMSSPPQPPLLPPTLHRKIRIEAVDHHQGQTLNSKFMCTLCQIAFRNRQNLEVHQKFYCRGSLDSLTKHAHSQLASHHNHQEAVFTAGVHHPISGKRSHQELAHPILLPERKFSVLERPTIITNRSPSPSSVRSGSGPSVHFSSPVPSTYESSGDGGVEFGNILKSKLLSFEQKTHKENDSVDTASMSQPLKKRKISEPAFRYHYPDSKHDSLGRLLHGRMSAVQAPPLCRMDAATRDYYDSVNGRSTLEMLPAYSPYLMRPQTKITIKGPVLFPVLQELIDTCTNHEFTHDQSATTFEVEKSALYSNNENFLGKFAENNLKTNVDDEQKQKLSDSFDSSTVEVNSFKLVSSDYQPESKTEFLVKELLIQLVDQVTMQVELSPKNIETGIIQEEEEINDKKLFNNEVMECVNELIVSVTNQVESLTVQKKCTPTRPTSLNLGGQSFNQSARNQYEFGEKMDPTSRNAIFVNRRSNLEEEEVQKANKNILLNQLIASNLVSPDTPRPKRKYQQLYINGNAYTNLGLKVTTRPTYCCIFRAQPMVVTQEANPQLSMYSQWKVCPLPLGDILEQLRSPHELLSAYNSQEAVFAVSRSRLSLVEVATAVTMGGLHEAAAAAEQELLATTTTPASEHQHPLPSLDTIKLSGTVTREFLDRVASRLANYMSSGATYIQSRSNRPQREDALTLAPLNRNLDRTLRSLMIPLGEGFTVKLIDTATRSQFILTHSSHYRLSQLQRSAQAQFQRAARKRSRSHNVDFYNTGTTPTLNVPIRPSRSSVVGAHPTSTLPSTTTEMVISTSTFPTNNVPVVLVQQVTNSSTSSSVTAVESAVVTNNNSTKTLKLPDLPSTLASWTAKARKRSSTANPSYISCTSLTSAAASSSSSTYSPFLTMHPMLGHLPTNSKQKVMYIMMMSQAPLAMSVPSVHQLSSSKSLASRKFSECIGVRPPHHGAPMVIDTESGWSARVGHDGSTEFMPKRIKIFEGGFKSNEDYTYVRGRGRGKYVCEECGIRCKKPSMLKKHIRTHTDLRPYSCRHCAFAFKTKGNLTKHMKSKAHHKKCVELGIFPVPTSIDDSQIDTEALAKQEQYELASGGELSQFADDDEDCDEDYDEEYDDEDEDDDEGVPIPLIEQQRLTYIVPGQFEDADADNNHQKQASSNVNSNHSSARLRKISHRSSDSSSTVSATSSIECSLQPQLQTQQQRNSSPHQRLSTCSVASVSTSTASSVGSSSPGVVDNGVTALAVFENDKTIRKFSSSPAGTTTPSKKLSWAVSTSAPITSPISLPTVALLTNNQHLRGNTQPQLSSHKQDHFVTNMPQAAASSGITATSQHQNYSQSYLSALASVTPTVISSVGVSVEDEKKNGANHTNGDGNDGVGANKNVPTTNGHHHLHSRHRLTADKNDDEAEAAHSLLILSSGLTQNCSNDPPQLPVSIVSSANSSFPSSVASSIAKCSNAITTDHSGGDNAINEKRSQTKISSSATNTTSSLDHHQHNSLSSLPSTVQDFTQRQSSPTLASTPHRIMQTEVEQKKSTDRIIYEAVSAANAASLVNPHVLLASQNLAAAAQMLPAQQPPRYGINGLNASLVESVAATTARTTPTEMMRQVVNQSVASAASSQPEHATQTHKRTSQPTSVIIAARQPPLEVAYHHHHQQQQQRIHQEDTEAVRWKRNRHERSISESNSDAQHNLIGAQANLMPDMATASLAALSSMCTSSGTSKAVTSGTNSNLLNLNSFMPTAQAATTSSVAAAAAYQQQVAAFAFAQQQQFLQQYSQQFTAVHNSLTIADEIKRAIQANGAVSTARPSSSPLSVALPSRHSPNNLDDSTVLMRLYENLAKQPPPDLPTTTLVGSSPLKSIPVASSGMSSYSNAYIPNVKATHSSMAISPPMQSTATAPILPHSLRYLVPSTDKLQTPSQLHANELVTKSQNDKQLYEELKQVSTVLVQPPNNTSVDSRSIRSPPQHMISAVRHFVKQPSTYSTNVNVPLTSPTTIACTASQSTVGGDDMEEPMDLSKSSKSTMETVVNAETITSSPQQQNLLTANSQQQMSLLNLVPGISSNSTSSSLTNSLSQASSSSTATSQHASSPNRSSRGMSSAAASFSRPLVEKKHLTEQIVRAFSPFSGEMIPIPTAGGGNHGNNNAREMYKNIRSEEFAHLTPGVHTPNRLPQNLPHLLLSDNNLRKSSPSQSGAGPSSTLVAATPATSSATPPNARSLAAMSVYTNAEGKSVCSICMKQFSKPSQLRLHINIHFFERPFRCDSCAVSFRTKGHLQKHSRSVSHLNKLNMNITFGRPSTDNPRPFKCSDCKIAFRIHGHLAKHLRSKMHIMKLECLGKLPFGMFAEMERSSINLTPIDTTDCEKALESLRSLAQKLYDPRQMCWKPVESVDINNSNDDTIEEDMDEDLDDEEGYHDGEDYVEGASSEGSSSSFGVSCEDSVQFSNTTASITGVTKSENVHLAPESTLTVTTSISTSTSSMQTSTSASTNTSSNNWTASISIPTPTSTSTSKPQTTSATPTRSNTCQLCGRHFKAVKFLQVHIYTDHPELTTTSTSTSITSDTPPAMVTSA